MTTEQQQQPQEEQNQEQRPRYAVVGFLDHPTGLYLNGQMFTGERETSAEELAQLVADGILVTPAQFRQMTTAWLISGGSIDVAAVLEQLRSARDAHLEAAAKLAKQLLEIEQAGQEPYVHPGVPTMPRSPTA